MNEELEKILKESHYQTFEDLDGRKRDSDSAKKFELSRLSEMDLKGKSCLDVGCNSGYFLFKLLDKKLSYMVGIDSSEKFIDIAENLNIERFKSGIHFLQEDIFSYKFERKFDLILCISTFHYFQEKQEEFLIKSSELLTDGGFLLLEVEEFPGKKDSPCIWQEVRPADRKMYRYPNELQIREWVKGLFKIQNKYLSVKQGGSLYERYFYRLQKV
jgi:SAM-dependent methyltransferase